MIEKNYRKDHGMSIYCLKERYFENFTADQKRDLVLEAFPGIFFMEHKPGGKGARSMSFFKDVPREKVGQFLFWPGTNRFHIRRATVGRGFTNLLFEIHRATEETSTFNWDERFPYKPREK